MLISGVMWAGLQSALTNPIPNPKPFSNNSNSKFTEVIFRFIPEQLPKISNTISEGSPNMVLVQYTHRSILIMKAPV